MTWTVTEQGAGSPAAGSGDFSSGAFTPAANSFLLAFVIHSNDGSVSGVTGHGTWSLIQTVTDITASGSNRDLEVWGCRVGGSPSSSAVTFSRSYTFRTSFQVIEFSETAGINGSSVADAVGTGSGSGAYRGTGPTTLSETLAAFAQSTNLTLVTGLSQTSFGGTNWSPDTGYTELSEWDSSSTNFSCATSYIASEDTSPSIVLDASNVNAGIFAIEVKHSGGGGGGGAARTGLTLLGVG